MLRDYGYIEDGRLGKPYDLRLLRRLVTYAVPYRKAIVVALACSVIITLCDLAMPYFSKVAIDRFIVPYWYRIAADTRSTELVHSYGQYLLRSSDRSFYLISSLNLKKLDPRDLHKYRKSKVLSNNRYYVLSRGPDISLIPKRRSGRIEQLENGLVVVPVEVFKGMPPKLIADLRKGDLRGLAVMGVVLAALVFTSFSLGYIEYYLLEYTGQNIMQDIRMKLYHNIQRQSVKFFGKHPIGRLVTRVTNDIENLNEMFKSVAVTLFKDFFILAGIMAVLFYMNWRLALLCMVLVPVVSFFTFLFSSLAREAFRELRAKVAKINAFLGERLGAISIIQLFCAEKAQEESFRQINHENFMAGMKQIQVFAVFMPLMELLSSFGVALILWYGGGKVIQDRLTLGALVAFLSYIQMFFKPIRDISEKYNIMQSAMASIERIFQFMDYREILPEPARAKSPKSILGHLKAEGLSFSYNGKDVVLRNVSFELKPGEVLGIVGHTGSGKTTLANLLLRMYDPDQGTIYLDGIELNSWPVDLLRKEIAPVMQDVFLFSGSIEENIRLGRKYISRNDLTQTLRITNLYQMVQALPNGIHQPVGERGISLSAGQQQLLSFARAVAGKPRILILDEATSSVDPETETIIREAMSRITAKQTTLIIAHRLSTVRNAHQILVLHRGEIRERGTHDELMAARGIYYRLNRLQEKLKGA